LRYKNALMPFDSGRHVALHGAFNFRDVGGLPAAGGRPVRRGLLFRSDSLSRLTPADLQTVQGLGLRTVVDLRATRERASAPDRLPQGQGIRCVHLPMRDPTVPESRLRMMAELVLRGPSTDLGALLRQHYTAFAFQCGASVGALLRLIADEANLPLLVHCTAGKDRTGFTVAVVLRILGVSVEDVLADHLVTNELLRPALPRYVRMLRWLSLGRLTEAQMMPLLEARAEDLEDVLREIEVRHGSIERWLEEECGVGAEHRERIAQALVGAT
jgi:protein-tyrosine phosphatase